MTMAKQYFYSQSKYWMFSDFFNAYDFKFDPIKAYLDHSDQMIKLHKEEVKRRYDLWEKERGQDNEIPEAYDILEEEIINNAEFGKILNNSVFLTIYSMFEHELLNICLICKKAEGLALGPKDLTGRNYIGQCKKFITKLVGVNLDSLNQEWEKIQKYQQLRNTITHRSGKITDPKPDIIDFIDQTDGVSIDTTKSIITIDTVEFLKELIDLIIKYLTSITKEIVCQKDK